MIFFFFFKNKAMRLILRMEAMTLDLTKALLDDADEILEPCTAGDLVSAKKNEEPGPGLQENGRKRSGAGPELSSKIVTGHKTHGDAKGMDIPLPFLLHADWAKGDGMQVTNTLVMDRHPAHMVINP
jgi:hypothetical protein